MLNLLFEENAFTSRLSFPIGLNILSTALAAAKDPPQMDLLFMHIDKERKNRQILCEDKDLEANGHREDAFYGPSRSQHLPKGGVA